jgi:predicted dehydrogenase
LQRNDIQLIAVLGNSKKSVDEFSKKFKIKGISENNFEELKLLDVPIDGFIVATPEWVRKDIFLKLNDLNCEILVEKPLVTSAQDLAFVKELMSGKEEKVSLIHSLRFSPRFQQAWRMLKDHRMDIRHIFSRRNPNQNSVKRVLGKFPLEYWLTCHDIDLMRWLTNSDIESVAAFTRDGLKTEDDYLIIHLKFKNGIDAIHEISWCAPAVSGSANTCSMSVRGTFGQIEIDDSDMNIKAFLSDQRVLDSDTYEHYEIGQHFYGLFFNVIDCWIRHLHGEKAQRVTFQDGVSAVAVCIAIEKSVQLNGARIAVE